MKDHKFFEKNLNNDLKLLSNELINRYKEIEASKYSGTFDISSDASWVESQSISTAKWQQYNVFQFHLDETYSLYKAVAEMTKEACEYYGFNFDEQKYMIQGWFNVNYRDKGKLGWHKHNDYFAPVFHGYYSVNAEPSITNYKIMPDSREVDVVNKNNKAILSELGHLHQMAEWDWDGPRITIAYDVYPLKILQKERMDQEQHWVPLC